MDKAEKTTTAATEAAVHKLRVLPGLSGPPVVEVAGKS